MKLVREHINEKFTQDSDPISDMGIGIFVKRDFKSEEELYNFLAKYLPYILKLNKIPDVFILTTGPTFCHTSIKIKYHDKITDYIRDYITINGEKKSERGAFSVRELGKRLKEGTLIVTKEELEHGNILSEKFVQGSDSVRDMGIGTIFHKRDFDTKDDAYDFIAKNILEILCLKRIPLKLIKITGKQGSWSMESKQYKKIYDYVDKYMTINNKDFHFFISDLAEKLKKGIYDINRTNRLVEKFTQDSDPIEDMGIGRKTQLIKKLKELEVPEQDIEITDDFEVYFGKYIPWRSDKIHDVQFDSFSKEKRKFAEAIIKLLNKRNGEPTATKLESIIQAALDDGISVPDIKKILKEFGTDYTNRISVILLAKLIKTQKQKKEDEENNIYVFIGFMDKVPVKIRGKTYYEDKFNTETLVKIDKYNITQLQMVSVMKIRAQAQYGGMAGSGVYMLTVPKDFMDEDSYTKIPEEYYDLIVEHKRRI